MDTTPTDRRLEILEVAVLALVAIATAWSGYQGSAWGGRQSVMYAQASTDRLEAEALSTHGGQVLVADATIFTAWLQANDAGDASLMAQLERRFTPEYATAFEDWLALDPLDDPDAPPGPAAMPGFQPAGFQQAAALNDQATTLLNGGTAARETANDYIRGTVLFAAVLFLIAIAQRFSIRGARIAVNVLAIVLFLFAVGVVITLPRV